MSNEKNDSELFAKLGISFGEILSLVASLPQDVSPEALKDALMGYSAFLARYDRPDPALHPGMYVYERWGDELPRTLVSFNNRYGTRLQGYLYEVENSAAIAVVVHGIHSGADDYLPLIKKITEGGYSVFAFDCTGTYSSEGETLVGMCQNLSDLNECLNFLADAPFAKGKHVFVVGHSWGGYAAASVLALHPEVRAAVLIAPMNNASTIMAEQSERHNGPPTELVKPIFDIFQTLAFHDLVQYDGVYGINSTSARVLIAQGINDTVISHNKESITAQRKKIDNPRVEYLWCTGSESTHNGVWHSPASAEYMRKVADTVAVREYLRGAPLTEAELREYYSGIDHRLYSEVSEQLMERIYATFSAALADTRGGESR